MAWVMLLISCLPCANGLLEWEFISPKSNDYENKGLNAPFGYYECTFVYSLDTNLKKMGKLQKWADNRKGDRQPFIRLVEEDGRCIAITGVLHHTKKSGKTIIDVQVSDPELGGYFHGAVAPSWKEEIPIYVLKEYADEMNQFNNTEFRDSSPFEDSQ